MRVWLWIAFFGASAASAAFVARPSEAKPTALEQSEQREEREQDLPDFVPSEKVPADSAVAFPVDI